MKPMKATSGKETPACKVFLFAIVGTIVGLSGIWCPVSVAQTPPITASGLNTQISGATTLPSGQTQYNITGGTRPGGGTNLFHSFGNFNVPNNNIANFLNNSGLPTANILGRVTGGNISNIFGTIQTTGFGNANLFLMNPAGFLFGPTAMVNVGGMVAFTSADYLRLADGALFNAIPTAKADGLLSASPVAAFGFLGSNPGAITVQGSQFSVSDGMGISFIGGSINIQSGTLANGTVQPARLSAPNGQINLATAASPGEFLLQGLQTGGFQPSFPFSFFDNTSLAGPNINGASFTSFGTVHLAPGSTMDVSQTGTAKVSIRGGQIVLDVQNALLTTADSARSSLLPSGQNNIFLSPGSSIFSSASGTTSGADIGIVADNIQLFGSPIDLSNLADLSTPLVQALIQTQTDGSGAAGNISLTATHNIQLFDAAVVSFSVDPGTGTAGNIDLTSTQGNISLASTSQVTSQNNAGTLSLNAPHGDIVLSDSQVVTFVTGTGTLGPNAGGIQINANNLTLSNLGLNPSSIEGDNFVPIVPGNITINLSGNLNMDGGSQMRTVSQGLGLTSADLSITAHNMNITGGSFLTTKTVNAGHGGQLTISADNLQLTNGGQLISGSLKGIDPLTGDPTIPSGPGGTITIQGHNGPANSVLIDGAGSGIFVNSQGTGPGGNTNISAQSVTIQNGGVVSAQANAVGAGGEINISANNLHLATGGQLTSGSLAGMDDLGNALPPPSGRAGQITIQGLTGPSNSVLIDGANSGIFSNAVATGAAGNTNITAQSVTIQNAGTISAATSGTAPTAIGGSININATSGVTMTNGGSITASSSGPANAGNIFVNAGSQLLMQASSIKTEAAQAGGGNIEIQAANLVQLGNSTVSTSVLGGGGSGGNITIDPSFVILQNSQVLAQAVEGSGGNIFITTNLLLPDSTSIISASSAFGQQGTVTIQSPISPASGKIVPLGQKPLMATSLVSQRCAALAGGNSSSFTVAGRDSLPAEPASWLSSPLAMEMSDAGDAPSTVDGSTIEERPLLSLRQIAPAGFLLREFPSDGSEGCSS